MVEATYALVIKHQVNKRALHMQPSRSNSMANMGQAMSRFFGSVADMVSITGGLSRRSMDLQSPKGRNVAVPFVPFGGASRDSPGGIPTPNKLRVGSVMAGASPRRGSLDQLLGTPGKGDNKRLSLQFGGGNRVQPLPPSK